MATCVPGLSHSRLFFALDRLSLYRFLIVQSDRCHRQSGVDHQATNGVPIPTYGTRSLTLNLGLYRLWVFTVADVKHPILGADFLGHHKLIETPDPSWPILYAHTKMHTALPQ